MFKKVGLTGFNAAGKGVVAGIFSKYGFSYFSLSDIVRNEAKRKGLELTRDNLIMVGNGLREKGGPGILAHMIMNKLDEFSIIDSIRNPEEIHVLRGLDGFIFAGVNAVPEVRFKRMQARGRTGDPATYEDFLAKERIENTTAVSGLQLGNCLEMADIIIENNGSIKELEEYIVRAFKLHEKKGHKNGRC